MRLCSTRSPTRVWASGTTIRWRRSGRARRDCFPSCCGSALLPRAAGLPTCNGTILAQISILNSIYESSDAGRHQFYVGLNARKTLWRATTNGRETQRAIPVFLPNGNPGEAPSVTYVTERDTTEPYSAGHTKRWRCCMKGKVFSFLIVAAGFAMVSRPISAHHGVTNYDMNKTIVLTGTITAFDWSNPHCLAHLDAMDDS